MNYILIFALSLIVIFMINTRETFKSKRTLDDDRPDLSKYTESEASVNNDMIQEFILKANAEISKRMGVCTYIIETNAVKKYVGEENGKISDPAIREQVTTLNMNRQKVRIFY